MSSSSPLNRRVPKTEFNFSFTVMSSLLISNWLYLVCHLWTDEYPISPFFVVMSYSSPLNDNSEHGGFSIGHVQFITSEPTDSQVSPFCLLLCPVRHLWTVNTPNLVISSQLCPIHHLWTDEYPISPFFVVMSVRHLWMTRLHDWWFLNSYV